MNKIASRFFTIGKQNVNKLIKTKTNTNIIKVIIKMTKNENKKKVIKKITTKNIITTKNEKKLIIKIKNEMKKKI